jgi:biopolymer transport protein TolR
MARRQKTRRPIAEINVVPYIDVMLVLLVIFMITAPLLTQGVKVDLVEADARPVEEDARRPLVVSVEADGTWSVTYDDDRVREVDAAALLQMSSAIIKSNPGIPVLVKGDRSVAYDHVVQAMVVLQQAGAPSVGLITQPPETLPGAVN